MEYTETNWEPPEQRKQIVSAVWAILRVVYLNTNVRQPLCPIIIIYIYIYIYCRLLLQQGTDLLIKHWSDFIFKQGTDLLFKALIRFTLKAGN